MNLCSDTSIIHNPYFKILKETDDIIEVHSNYSADDWMVTRSDDGYYILWHKHPWNKEYHYQVALSSFIDCILEAAVHDEYILRKRHYYILKEYSLVEKILNTYNFKSS